MDRVTQIHKKAFIALVNNLRRRLIVDTEYKWVMGKQKLVLIYEDGSQEIFKGLRAA